MCPVSFLVLTSDARTDLQDNAGILPDTERRDLGLFTKVPDRGRGVHGILNKYKRAPGQSCRAM